MEGRKATLVTNLSVPRFLFDFPCVDRGDFVRIADSNADRDVLKEIFGR
jgi:hypothetical protein